MKSLYRILVLASVTVLVGTPAVHARKKTTPTTPAKPATAPTTFAPVPADHPLADLWNDPEFTRRLIGSYGFLSGLEPRLDATEQKDYVEVIVPLLREDPQKAIPELQNRIKPDSSALFDFTLGNIYFQNADLTNAVRHFEAAVAKFPDFRRAWKNLGYAFLRDGRYAEATRPLTRAVGLGETDAKTYGLLGFAFLSTSAFVPAREAYRQAMLQEPDTLDFRLGLVKCQVALSEYSAALASLEELLRASPDNAALWSLQANIYVQQNQTDKAATSFEILRRLGKATPENLDTLGDIYLARDAHDLALEAYLECAKLEPAERPSRSLRAARILVDRGAFEEARTLVAAVRSKAETTLSSEDDVSLLKLESRIAMATGASEEAIAVLERIIERNPLDGEALLLAGDHYARQGKPEKAEFRFETAAKLPGFEAQSLLKQAQLLVQSRRYAQAVELLKKAQKIQPRENVQRYLERVETTARSGRL